MKTPLKKENVMFKHFETVWNARTPVYLHNRTKENFIFQLALTAVLVGGMIAYDQWKDRREEKKLNEPEHLRAV